MKAESFDLYRWIDYSVSETSPKNNLHRSYQDEIKNFDF